MRIGIDLGGTKIEAIALSPEGEVLARHRVATVRDNYASTIHQVVELVERIESALGARGSVGIAMPGAISPATGLVKNANSTWLNGQTFDKDLCETLGRPVRFANDANCFALSEAIDGAGEGHRAVFGVILGTGCGGGIVVDRQALTGRHSISGEWGHNPLPWPSRDELENARACYCGKHGCLETWISGPGFESDHARLTGNQESTIRVAERFESGDSGAIDSLHRLADRIARGLASVMNILDPDVIVLGGGLSNIDALYTLVPERLPLYVFSDRVDVPVLRNVHGDSGGVRGAAWLWPAETD